MLPKQDKYPQFVPDQLLTSEHLNNLFNYLEEQGRMTRTNLIGIGIVCGLEVKTDNTSITITKGCGVTSSGYLITVEEKTYTQFKAFNPVKDIKYDRFVAANDTARFPMDELKEAAVEEGTSPITAEYLKNKVVLIFVELLQEGAKNCDPNSCDDKGINITVSFRPLIIDAADAAKLNSQLAGNVSMNAIDALPSVKMRRFDVEATALLETEDIFEAYRKVLSASFLSKAKDTLSKSYTTLAPLVFDMFSSNPFAALSSDFSFLHDNSINDDQLVNIQYYYDLFDNVMQAYEELRHKGMELLCLCCPDEDLFPRHLLLGRVSPGNTLHIEFRQYFIASPIHCHHAQGIEELRWLFKRLVLMIQKFSVPPPTLSLKNKRTADANIRITPSKLGDVIMSDKSIPYYYKVAETPDALYQYWNYFKTLHGQANQNLSYHADKYNTTDEHISAPLLYDIEPYNFLRIEGHLGKPYAHAVKNILALRNKYRLPFEVLALSGNISNLRTQLLQLLRGASLSSLNQTRDESMSCHFADLEAQYVTQRAELICILCKELKYSYAFPADKQLPAPSSLVPQVSLLQYCDPDFRFTANTNGHSFEVFYKNLPAGYTSADTWLKSFQAVMAGANLSSNNSNNNLGIMLMYYIVKLYESMSDSLADFDYNQFSTRYDDLVKIAESIKTLFAGLTANENNTLSAISEDVIDHLDTLIYACKKAPMEALYKEYRLRWIYLLMLQRFGYYVKKNPGIQHKGGVPLGGTFILVYHEETVQPQIEPNFTTGFSSVREAAGTSNTFTAATGFTANLRREAAAETMSEARFTSSGNEASFNVNTDAVKTNISSGNVAGFNISRYIDALQQLFVTSKRDDATIDDVVEEITNGTVIADFYLPYICCSDCPPIQFVINEKETTENPTINIDAKEYCSDDKGAYNISVSPAGGTVTGEGVSSNADGNFIFTPSAVNLADADSKKITFTYDVNGATATVEVIVYQKPTASISISRGDDLNTVFIDNNSKHAQTWAWDFGDGQSADIEHPDEHTYKDPGEYVITLKLTNGICSAVTQQTVSILKPEQVGINIDGKEYCSDDKTAYQVSVNPAGGTASGEGVKTASGKTSFTPAVVKLNGAINKKVTLSYTKDGQTASTEVTVYQNPTAAFQFTIDAASGLTVKFQNFSQSAPSFIWDFGDGKKSEEKEPTHQYEKAGNYTVTLQAINGVCSASFAQPVVLKAVEVVTKSCLPLGELITSFQKLQAVDTASFAQFTKNYTFYKEIEAFFKKLDAVASNTSDKQIAFLSDLRFTGPTLTNNLQLTFPQELAQWLNLLFNSFIFDAEDKTRLLALTLYRILENLAMYVECIQPEDLGKAKVDMAAVFALIQRQLEQLAQVIANFSNDKKAVVKQLQADIDTELKRLAASGEATGSKQAYNRVLSALTTIITKYKL